MIGSTFSLNQSSSTAEAEAKRKAKLLRVICLIALILGATATVTATFNTISSKGANFINLLIVIGFTLVSGTGYKLADETHYQLSSLLMVGGSALATLAIIYQSGTNLALLMIVMLPITLAIVLLDTRGVLFTTFSCMAALLLLFVLQDMLKIYTPILAGTSNQLVTELFCVLVLIPALVAIIVIPFKDQTRKLQAQNERLTSALEELEKRQQVNQNISQQVLALSAQLKSTATQQSVGSEEQVALVTQVGSSITELSTTAAYIADSAHQVSLSTEEMAAESQRIEHTTSLSADKGQQGKAAVVRTISASLAVAELYQQLRQTLSELNTKSTNMRRILDLLGTISGETHLLAMNAAIEAAGAGEMGARFKVVAQEVKNLATRSNQANMEVLAIVQEIEQATLNAVKSVEDGYQRAQAMGQIVEEAGTVIEEMHQITVQAQTQATVINQTARQVREHIETIKAATTQQHSSSQQVLDAISGLTVVAQQNTEGSALISSTAVHLEENSLKLNFSLSN